MGSEMCIRDRLKHISENEDFDYVIPMDGDGEDRPEEIRNFVEKIKDNPGLYENLFDNSVRIMTIHSSKGLESEVVFLAQTYLSNNVKKQLRIIPIFNDDLTCKNLYLYLPKFFKNNRMIEKKFMPYKDKENLEELNLLYVACTRARNLLVINGFSDSKYSNSWFANLLSSQ